MKTKHTEGEWRAMPFGLAEEGVTKVLSNIPNNGFGTWICSTFVSVSKVDESEANAKLIAAAPDMLEALMNLENDDNSIPKPLWDMVKKAIKKAI